jgi:hypothetical protein
MATAPTEFAPMDIDSREWDQLCQRRAALIYKKNRQGLSDEERTEYERLEKIVDATMEAR